jgi:hypothetical protein
MDGNMIPASFPLPIARNPFGINMVERRGGRGFPTDAIFARTLAAWAFQFGDLGLATILRLSRVFSALLQVELYSIHELRRARNSATASVAVSLYLRLIDICEGYFVCCFDRHFLFQHIVLLASRDAFQLESCDACRLIIGERFGDCPELLLELCVCCKIVLALSWYPRQATRPPTIFAFTSNLTYFLIDRGQNEL